jgi:hypothetical protein
MDCAARLQALVLGRRLLMAFASAGDGAEFEASGAQHREAGAAHVILDRVADVQLIDSVTGGTKNSLAVRLSPWQ